MMTSSGIKMGPPHPGTFIGLEILDEFGLSVSEAAGILEAHEAPFSSLVKGNASLSP